MTAVTKPRYVPILKGKRGELDALRDVAGRTREGMYPLVELLPGAEQDVAHDINRTLKVLAERWFAQPIMLDVGHFDEEDNDRSILAHAMDSTVGLISQAVPVFRLADGDMVYGSLAEVCDRDGHGAALRILAEDLDADPDELSEQIDTALKSVGLTPGDVDAIVDLGAISGDIAVLGGYRLVQSMIRGLDQFTTFRSFTVAAGAFPVDLSGVSPWTLGEHPRDDAALYNRLRARPAKRTIDFGDYAIAHPLLSPGPPFAPPPQLRYTVSDRWLSLKSKRNDPRGNNQFYDVCVTIAAHPDFAGADLGSADARIASARTDGPGNATTWRTIGTVHHADLVVSRLTTLGEP
jgi:hypothetical protein